MFFIVQQTPFLFYPGGAGPGLPDFNDFGKRQQFHKIYHGRVESKIFLKLGKSKKSEKSKYNNMEGTRPNA